MKRSVALVVIFAMLTAVASSVTIPKGSKEFAIEGLFDSKTSNGDFADLTIVYGEFSEDNLEVGLQVAIKDSDNVEQWRAGIRIEFNNADYEIMPFVALTLEYASFEIDYPTVQPAGEEEPVTPVEQRVNREGEAVVIGGHAGLKWFIAENVAVSGAFVYEWAGDDIFEDDNRNLKETDASIRLGMRFFF